MTLSRLRSREATQIGQTRIAARRAALCFALAAIMASISADAVGATGADETAEAAERELAAPAIFHPTCSGGLHEIRVTVSGVKKSVGVVSADLYPDDPEKFLKGPERLNRVIVAAKAPVTRFCMTAPGAARFLVSAYHDLDADGDFDKGVFGIPVEPWGLSNNPKARFGPPLIDETLFQVEETGAAIEINFRR